jgi:hypothetical protein
MWWHSVQKDTTIVEAVSESEAYKKFGSNFGYENVDIIDCMEVKD